MDDWTKAWLLEFNADKCKLMQVGRPPSRNYTTTNKSRARVDPESINEEKDVGVWATTDLKSSTQCQKASKKAMQALSEEILQIHDKRFICDIIQSICPTTPRILCSGMEPVQRGDLETYKILTGLENIEASKFFEMRQPGRIRGHTVKIFKPRARLLTRQRFFSIRVIDLWNGLPQNVEDATTVPQFKARLDQY